MAANSDILTKPFPADQIKSREVARGRNADYVEFGDVARRLIEGTSNAYNWTIIKIELMPLGEKVTWLCQGRLQLEGLGTRDGIGTHDAFDVESAKAAETDAFKRAASKFGVALELYDKDRKTQGHSNAGNNGHSGGTQSNGAGMAPGAIWEGPGQCPRCHAPEGKRHGKPCIG